MKKCLMLCLLCILIYSCGTAPDITDQPRIISKRIFDDSVQYKLSNESGDGLLSVGYIYTSIDFANVGDCLIIENNCIKAVKCTGNP